MSGPAPSEPIRVADRLEFPYVRSLGPVVGAFADALVEAYGGSSPNCAMAIFCVEHA